MKSPEFIHLSETSAMTRFEYSELFEFSKNRLLRITQPHIKIMIIKSDDDKMSFTIYEN